jgi:SNF2 family DNA or RNA helicase
MKNGRPVQLYPLLAAIGHPLAADQRAFEERYCQGHWLERGGKRQWQALGATHLEELQRLTRPLVLHRRKQDCLDLPPKQRLLLPVTLSEAEGQGFQHRLQLKVDDYRRRAEAGLVRRDAEVLAVFTALRQISAEYKLAAAADLLQRLQAQGEPVVLFTAFVAAAELLHGRLGGGLLTGRLAPAARQQVVDDFQAGHQPLLISTFGVGGLGFTLHRARHVVLLERPWTPGDAEQAEDRCHRIGMQGRLQCHWLQLGVADQLVDDLIASKADRIEQLLRRRSWPGMVRTLLEQW